MNKKFPMTNYRGMAYLLILTCLLLGLTSLFSVFLFSGQGTLWLIPTAICFFLFIVAIMGFLTTISIGIDVKDGVIWLPDPNMPRRSLPVFELNKLANVHLENQDGEIVAIDAEDYTGCRIIFTLDDGETHQYYPMILNKRQYKRLDDALTESLA